MDININHLEVTKTARYATYGKLTNKTKYFWFALHGSKMQCDQVLYKFSDFDPETHFIVAPEALSRFYLEGFGGDVVAMWMTKRDRLKEISDFSNYLSILFNKYASQVHPDCKKIVLGFSQGGTTLYRWLHHDSINIDCLIAYSCWIPEDIDLTASKTELNATKAIFTYGLQDQFLTSDRVEALKQVISKNQLKVIMEPHEGLHKIKKTQLKFLFEKHIATSFK